MEAAIAAARQAWNLQTVQSEGGRFEKMMRLLSVRHTEEVGRFARGPQRVRHLHDRPQLSATYVAGETAALIVHGTAREAVEGQPLLVAWDSRAHELYDPVVEFSKKRTGSREKPKFTRYIGAQRMSAQGFAAWET